MALSHLIGVASSSVSYTLPGILPVYIVKYIACIYCQVYCQQQHVSWLPNAFSSTKSCLQAESTDLVGMSHFLTWSTSSSLWSSNLNYLNSLLMSYTYQTSRDKDSCTKVLPCNKSWLKQPLKFRCSRVVLTTRSRSLWSQQRLWVLLHDGSFEGTSCHMCNVRTHSTWMLLKDRDFFLSLKLYKFRY